MMVRVKICGITNLEDALICVKAGCDALGFVFYKKSRRYISPREAKKIIRRLPKNILKVGVFVNGKERSIKNTANLCGLNALQFHGNESPDFCKKFRNYKVIKVFRIKDRFDFSVASRYKVYAYLFDTFKRGKAGGTGSIFNWSLIRKAKKLNKTIFLSGGLNAKNVLKAMAGVNPDWFDASSALEEKPGKKDRSKVISFISILKGRRRRSQ